MSFYFQGDTLKGILWSLYEKYENKNDYFEQVQTITDSIQSESSYAKYAIDFNYDYY